MKLYYAHDPMCSWCWAFRPGLLQLLENLPPEVTFIRLLGGLAADSDALMPDDTREYIIKNWQRIQEEVPNTTFNYDFWKICQPRRSTYPSCRAVIAARKQGVMFDSIMSHAIQQAYYLHAKNPSDLETLHELAAEIGLDTKQFANDIISKDTNKILLDEINTAHQLGLHSFPSLLFVSEQKRVHITHDYNDSNVAINNFKQALVMTQS